MNGSMAVSSGKWYYEVNIVGDPDSAVYAGSPFHFFGWGLASVVKDTRNISFTRRLRVLKLV